MSWGTGSSPPVAMLLNHPSFPVGLPDRLIFYISSTSCRPLARSPSSTCFGLGSGAIWRSVSSPTLFSQSFLKVPAETRQVLSSQVYTVPLPSSSPGLKAASSISSFLVLWQTGFEVLITLAMQTQSFLLGYNAV